MYISTSDTTLSVEFCVLRYIACVDAIIPPVFSGENGVLEQKLHILEICIIFLRKNAMIGKKNNDINETLFDKNFS